MYFQIKDKVKVIDDDQKGVVISIHGNQVEILNEFGFEETYSASELILDKSFEVGEVKIKEALEPERKTFKKKEVLAPKEVDLHIGELVDYVRNLSNYEMLQIQLQKVRDEIELAKAEKRQKLIFIHGHGKGKLRTEVLKVLQSYKGIEYYDASFRKYRGGATKVRIIK